MPNEELLSFNGIDGATGGYLLPPMTTEQFIDATFGKTALTAEQVDAAKDKMFDAAERDDLAWRNLLGAGHYGVEQGVRAERLDEAGWGVIFPFDMDVKGAIREALAPLIELRRGQAGSLFREYSGQTGYRWKTDAYRESKAEFLKRQGAESSGPVKPAKMPYYLLIVGDPDTIPYSFQYQMDVQYAVGRIYFETPEEYRRYAEGVVAAETGKIALPRRAAFFGPCCADDLSTLRSSTQLVPPLFRYAQGKGGSEWQVELVSPAESTRARLGQLMGGEDRSALLFTASHGMGVSKPDAQWQAPYSGSLVCGDWPGPKYTGKVRDFYFAGEDLAGDANVAGMIAMFFACYGAGTPQYNDFAAIDGQAERSLVAEKALVGRLPQRLLAHPKGGALAVMGHVDRVWDTSFLDDSSRPADTCFTSALGVLMEGKPIGMASEYFNSRYSEIGSMLSAAYDDAKWNKPPRPVDGVAFTQLWTSNNDARNYVIVGDPAVRLCFGGTEQEGGRERLVTTLRTAEPNVEPVLAEAPVLASFGIVDDTVEAVGDSLKRTLAAVGSALQQAVSSLANLEVTTYTSDRLSDVKYAGGVVTGAKLRAMTRVSIGGNTQVILPEDDGKVDDAVWKIHSEALEKALVNRNELVKVAVSAVTGLLGSVKK